MHHLRLQSVRRKALRLQRNMHRSVSTGLVGKQRDSHLHTMDNPRAWHLAFTVPVLLMDCPGMAYRVRWRMRQEAWQNKVHPLSEHHPLPYRIHLGHSTCLLSHVWHTGHPFRHSLGCGRVLCNMLDCIHTERDFLVHVRESLQHYDHASRQDEKAQGEEDNSARGCKIHLPLRPSLRRLCQEALRRPAAHLARYRLLIQI